MAVGRQARRQLGAHPRQPVALGALAHVVARVRHARPRRLRALARAAARLREGIRDDIRAVVVAVVLSLPAAAEAAVVVVRDVVDYFLRIVGADDVRLARVARRTDGRRVVGRRAPRVGAARRHAADVLPLRGREQALDAEEEPVGGGVPADEHAVDAPPRVADDAARRRRRREAGREGCAELRRGRRIERGRRVGHAAVERGGDDDGRRTVAARDRVLRAEGEGVGEEGEHLGMENMRDVSDDGRDFEAVESRSSSLFASRSHLARGVLGPLPARP